MAILNGYYFEPGISARHPATIDVSAERYVLHAGESPQRSGAVEDITVSARIGNVARRLQWPDGALFETTENDKLDSVLTPGSKKIRGGMLHRLESSWTIAACSGVLIAGLTFSVFKWGIPAAAHHIAMNLPVSTHELVSTGALATLDEVLFSPTELSESTQRDVEARFEKMIASLDGTEFNYRLYFRSMHDTPNAMALPSGQIIVTDAFVKLANEGELEAVLLHELGHVEQKHGMENAINASAVSVIISMALGDLGGANELITGIPTFLLQSSYSRKAENAADAFAFEAMARSGIDPKHFATVIRKLGESDDVGSEDKYNGYLSSHPVTEERAQRALLASEKFNSTRLPQITTAQ